MVLQAGQVTVREAAHSLGCNPETIRRWIREQKIPAHKLGSMWVINWGDAQKQWTAEKLGGSV